MHILLTGGTGLIGRALCRHWQAQGHQLSVWTRQPDKVAALCGPQVRAVKAPVSYTHLTLPTNREV